MANLLSAADDLATLQLPGAHSRARPVGIISPSPSSLGWLRDRLTMGSSDIGYLKLETRPREARPSLAQPFETAAPFVPLTDRFRRTLLRAKLG